MTTHNVLGRSLEGPFDVDGFSFWAMPNDGVLGKPGEDVKRIIESIVTEGQTVVDVGAHVGYFTLLMAKLVGPGGKVFAFEPHPILNQALVKNVAANGFSDIVEIHEMALSDKTAEASLCMSPHNSGDNRLEGGDDDWDTVEVQTGCLDDFVKDVSFIKIDTQGHDISVLRGARELIQRSPKITVCSEFWPEGMREAKIDVMEVVKEIRDLGFEIMLDGEIFSDDYARKLSEEPGIYKNLLYVKGEK